jgi:hypothetical protein
MSIPRNSKKTQKINMRNTIRSRKIMRRRNRRLKLTTLIILMGGRPRRQSIRWWLPQH